MATENVKTQPVSRRTIILNASALFVVVVIFITLSYFINSRGDNEVLALNEQNTTALQKVESLRMETERLGGENAELSARIEELEDELRQTNIDRARDLKIEEERHASEYEALLSQYNELLSQLEALEGIEE